MEWRDRICIDPAVMAGKPVVRSTRLTVEFLLGLLAEGWREEDLLDDYPGLTRADVLACIAYATHVLQSELVVPLPAV